MGNKAPTHWKDERGYVIDDHARRELGGDWVHFYNVPCKVGAFGRITPIHKCGNCNGKGRDPEADYDPCPVCSHSGGLPEQADEG